jgi:DNA-binding transcriptional LysR family regulator
MREVNLNGIDLNLVPPLEALLRERNVTRAAAAVGMSQPAMSRALARLRAALGDPLLLRGKRGLVLTPRAQALVPVVTGAMGQLKGVFQPQSFDPAEANRLIRIASSDTQSILLGPPLVARLIRQAPSVTLQMVPYIPDLALRLEDGSIDFAFALASTPLPVGARSTPIADDRLAVVMRRGHPAAKRRWTMADYGRFGHATIAILGDQQSDMDAVLAKAGISRKVAFTSPHFTAALATVAATDLVTTISETFARRFADPLGLVIKPAPFAAANLPMILVWSHVRAHDPLLLWFRGLVAEVAQETFFRSRRTGAPRAPCSTALCSVERLVPVATPRCTRTASRIGPSPSQRRKS